MCVCLISVDRIIPGDDSGVGDHLVLDIDSEFIREQGQHLVREIHYRHRSNQITKSRLELMSDGGYLCG